MSEHLQFTPFERLLSLITKVRPGEGRTVGRFCGHVFLILFAYYIFRSVREGLLLEHGTAAKGSYATAVIAGTLLILVPIYSAVRRRYDGARLVNAVLAFFATTLLGFWVAATRDVDVGFAFYVWVGIFNVMILAQFWALAADSFNVKTGQRLFPVIMLAAHIGALTGAEFTDQLAQKLGTDNLLLVGFALLLLTASFTKTMHDGVPEESRRLEETEARSPPSVFGGFEVVAKSRYLVLIAIMMVLINWISSTGDFIHRDFVKHHFGAIVAADGGQSAKDLITAYMGRFFFWMVILQLSIQVLLVGRLFRWIGVAGALLLPAALSLIGYGLVGFVPLLTVIRAVRLGEQSTQYSLTNTLRQALFLLTDRRSTYEGKTTIETFFWRFGDLLQAGVVYAGLNWLHWSASQFAVLNLILAVLWIGLAVAIGREFVKMAREKVTNLAPVACKPIDDLICEAGRAFRHVIPRDSFRDEDPGDVLRLRALLADGSPLPKWLRFNIRECAFSGVFPSDLAADITVRVVASDVDGMEAASDFRIRQQ